MNQFACHDCDATFEAPTDADTCRCPGCGGQAERQPIVSTPPTRAEIAEQIRVVRAAQANVDALLAAQPAAPPAPADQNLRDRIAQAVQPTLNAQAGRPGLKAQEIADAVLAVLPAPADRAAVLREAADELARGLGHEESVRELRRMADEAQQAPPADDRRAETALAEAVAVYAADRLGVPVADVLHAAADKAAADRAGTRPDGWAPGRDWRADLLRQHADTLTAADEQQAGEPAPEPLVHVGWWCWRGDNGGHLAVHPCRSDNVRIHVPAEWADEMRNVIQRIEDGDDETQQAGEGR